MARKRVKDKTKDRNPATILPMGFLLHPENENINPILRDHSALSREFLVTASRGTPPSFESISGLAGQFVRISTGPPTCLRIFFHFQFDQISDRLDRLHVSFAGLPGDISGDGLITAQEKGLNPERAIPRARIAFDANRGWIIVHGSKLAYDHESGSLFITGEGQSQ